MTRRTIERRNSVLSPWVSLIERVVSDGSSEAVFHSLEQADYVSVVALTQAQELVFVRQYRPAADAVTLELPGGLLEAGENPRECALRELTEETGFEVGKPLVELGGFLPDTGRLENRIWLFYAPVVRPVADWQPEAEVERCIIPYGELSRLIDGGEFVHMLHIGAIGLAVMRGFLPPFQVHETV